MLLAKLMIAADHAPLKKAPNAFDAICVNVAANPFFSTMVNAIVFSVPKVHALKGRRGIGINALGFRAGSTFAND